MMANNKAYVKDPFAAINSLKKVNGSFNRSRMI
jgi:hypothetical protein